MGMSFLVDDARGEMSSLVSRQQYLSPYSPYDIAQVN